MAWAMTSGPMPSPPMTAMRKAAIARFLQIDYRSPGLFTDYFLLEKVSFSRPGKRADMENCRKPDKLGQTQGHLWDKHSCRPGRQECLPHGVRRWFAAGLLLFLGA